MPNPSLLERLIITDENAIEFVDMTKQDQSEAINSLMQSSIRGHRAVTIINRQSVFSVTLMGLLIEDFSNKTNEHSDKQFATGFSQDASGKRNQRKNAFVKAFQDVQDIPLDTLEKKTILDFCYILLHEGRVTEKQQELFEKFSFADIESLIGQMQTVYRRVNETLSGCKCFEKSSSPLPGHGQSPKERFQENMLTVVRDLRDSRKTKPESDPDSTPGTSP